MPQKFDPQTNPIGLDGVELVEFSGPDANYLSTLFEKYGFQEIASIPGRKIRLYRQGNINFILNCEPGTFAVKFSTQHGPCISATGFKVFDAEQAFATAVKRGAKAYLGTDVEKGALPFPAIYGIGDSVVYFMDQKNSDHLYNNMFKVNEQNKKHKGVGFSEVDHFTNNVPVGEMQKWCDFYTKIFNFRETRFFDIRGEKTGLISKVMRSPCGKFSIPINEPTDVKSQIQEYLNEYHGSGVQHLALLTDNILQTLENLKSASLEFLTPPPESYYKMVPERVPNIRENLTEVKKHAVLVDGDDQGYLLQIFSKNIIGPIFFEIIQRQNHSGFGEGNFQALFDAIERDQRDRGFLT